MIIHLRPIFFILGLVLSKIALFMYLPTLLALFTGTQGFQDFAAAVVITHIVALGCIRYGKKQIAQKLGIRDMFVLTTLVWLIGSAFAALPFVFINHISFTDAYFETMSGITTTGSTVLSGLEHMAPSILLWRSTLQWLGGIGFIVMAVAILPMLNVGGMRLFQTESSDWSDKSAPRAKSVAIHIMGVYIILTMLCFAGYRFTGMNNFDAINFAFTTLSTGGYAPTDSSMNNVTNTAHWIATLFMFAGGLPFLLFIQSLYQKKPQLLLQDAQVKGFTRLVLFSGLAIALWLTFKNDWGFFDALRVSLFNVVSVVTTTGFGLDDFTAWGAFPTIIFAFLLLAGGCSGSTAGGMKIFRFQIAFALLKKQIMLLIHPSGVFVQRYNGRTVNDDIIRSVVAFFLTFIATIIVIAALLGGIGLDPITAITGAITAVANVGPGLGNIIGPTGNFASLPDIAKWLLSLGMLMGRLEILTILVLCFPAFWRN